MDNEPERDAAEAEAVRHYLDAIDVPPIAWAAIEERAHRLRRPRWQGYAGGLAGGAAAAALLVTLAGRALAPVPATHGGVQAYATVQAGPAQAPLAKTPGSGGKSANPSAFGTSTAAPVPILGVAAVRWRRHRYALDAFSPPPAALGRLLAGRPPVRAAWQVPGVVPKEREPFHILAVYALNGQRPAVAVAVLGRFGSGPPALWQARAAAPARRVPSHAPHT